MWYRIPTSTNKIYKGWEVFINKSSNFNMSLSVRISPAIEMELADYLKLSDEDKKKFLTAYSDFSDKKRKYTYSFNVTKRTLGIFEFVEPWKDAVKQSEEYIDNKLGVFKIENFK